MRSLLDYHAPTRHYASFMSTALLLTLPYRLNESVLEPR